MPSEVASVVLVVVQICTVVLVCAVVGVVCTFPALSVAMLKKL